MTKQPFNTFDLPTIHLPEEGHYVPPRTRDSAEAERRHELPAHSVLLEQQARGFSIADQLLRQPIDNREDIAFLHSNLALSLINTSWYTYAREAPDVMRRRLDLTQLADDHADWRETKSGLLTKTQAGLGRAVVLAGQLTAAHEKGFKTQGLAKKLGRLTGGLAVNLACMPLAHAPHSMTAEDIQVIARLSTLDLLKASRASHGTHTSIAQLALIDSPLSRTWRTEAPASNQAFDAIEQLQEEYALAS